MSTHLLITKRRAVQMLTAGAVSDLHRGALDEALDKIHTMLLLSRWHESESLLVDHMIRVALLSMAVSTTWEALQAPGWDEAKLAKLQAGLEAASTWPQVQHTISMERAFVLSAFELARSNQGGMSAVSGSVGGGASLADTFNESIYTPLWQNSWAQTDELLYLKSVAALQEAYREADLTHSYQALQRGLEKREREARAHQHFLDRWRYPFSAIAQPAWAKAAFAMMRGETMREMARAAVALERHRLRHGAWPEELKSLTPEFLREVPSDFMNGAPLRYRRAEGRRFALWSVGEDGRDGGGKPGSDDLVWPEPVPDDGLR